MNYTVSEPHIAVREVAIGSSVKYSMDTFTALFPLGDNDAVLRILSSTILNV